MPAANKRYSGYRYACSLARYYFDVLALYPVFNLSICICIFIFLAFLRPEVFFCPSRANSSHRSARHDLQSAALRLGHSFSCQAVHWLLNRHYWPIWRRTWMRTHVPCFVFLCSLIELLPVQAASDRFHWILPRRLQFSEHLMKKSVHGKSHCIERPLTVNFCMQDKR